MAKYEKNSRLLPNPPTYTTDLSVKGEVALSNIKVDAIFQANTPKLILVC